MASSPQPQYDDSVSSDSLAALAQALKNDIDTRTTHLQTLTMSGSASASPVSIPGSSGPSLAPPFQPLLSTSPPGAQSGKSGRVIEKLMAENDRLRRELKVESTARDEERKAKEAIQQTRDTLKSTNQNLVLQNNVDKQSLLRKERKLEELKTERDFERSQRAELEGSLKFMERQGDQKVQDLKVELSRETSERKRVVNEYDVLKESFRRLDGGYKARVDRLRGQMDGLLEERAKDHEVVRKLEVTVEQQSKELEKLRVAKKAITDKCQRVIDEAESEMRVILKMAKDREGELGTTMEEAQDTLGKMRHLIGVQKNLRKG